VEQKVHVEIFSRNLSPVAASNEKGVSNVDRKVHVEIFSCNLSPVAASNEKGMRAMWREKTMWKYSQATSHLSLRPMRKA
jgi:hypothetical protein